MDEPQKQSKTQTQTSNGIAETEDMADEQSTAENTPPAEAPQAETDTSDESANGTTSGEALIDIEALRGELEKLKHESQTNLDGWQRSRAEFTNYKRRTTQELADARERGALDALAKILPIMDDFERALTSIPSELEGHPWMNGTALILKNMQKVMDAYNIEELDPVGEEFDPNMHEAIGTEDSDDYTSGMVTTTLQKGYRSGERILRPALVRVAN